MNAFSFVFLLFIPCFFVFHHGVEIPSASSAQVLNTIEKNQIDLKDDPMLLSNILFQSTDGGQTWQDISQGLPENLQDIGFYAGDSELYLHNKKGMYRSKESFKKPVWEKVNFIDQGSNEIAFGVNKVFAYNYDGRIFQKINATGMWMPVYTEFKKKLVRTIFETNKGTVFVGCDSGLYKSTDNGKTWKNVLAEGWVMKMVDSKGVLLATSQKGIIRSADDGENWDLVVSEGGVGISVETIEGGFAAITYNTKSKTRRMRISADGGKTWLPIDERLPASESIASIKKAGDYLICGHPDGIFLSSNKGKSWNMVLPSIDKKVYNLYTSKNVIYAVARNFGC